MPDLETATQDIDLFCPGCGYDLRALEGGACPECGAAVDLAKLRETSIPWVLGEGVFGKAWGFWRTSELAALRTKRFCREVAKPVSLAHARRYRRVMVGVAWLTLLAIALTDWIAFVAVAGQIDEWHESFEDLVLSQPLVLGGSALLLLLFLAGFTGLHLYTLHPRGLPLERQNRAVALGHYACAPLMALPFILLLRVAGLVVVQLGRSMDIPPAEMFGLAVYAVTWLLLLLPPLLFLRCCYVFAGRTAQRSGVMQAGIAVYLPVLWVLWGVLIFGVLPATVGFIYLFILTA